MQLMIIRGDGLSRYAQMTLRSDSQNDRFDLIEERIVQSLGDRPSSSIGEIAKELGVNRSTASKYLHVLRAKRRVRFRQVGPVKLWSLEAEN